ncbi:MAG: hypothetical protein WBQ03_07595 [Candidatus Sulfotelmatobacter sp.]
MTAALEARGKKEVELNALPVERKVTPTLQRIADKYLAEIKATRKKKTYQAYSVALSQPTDG